VAQSLGGVDATLPTRSHVLDYGAQAGAQAVARGGATLSQQENNTWQMSRRTE
jgi:hypothetical protein